MSTESPSPRSISTCDRGLELAISEEGKSNRVRSAANVLPFVAIRMRPAPRQCGRRLVHLGLAVGSRV